MQLKGSVVVGQVQALCGGLEPPTIFSSSVVVRFLSVSWLRASFGSFFSIVEPSWISHRANYTCFGLAISRAVDSVGHDLRSMLPLISQMNARAKIFVSATAHRG
jgi:hypothetical protein